MTEAQRTPRGFPWIPLLVMATLTFTFVTSEFLPTGLLPDMAHELKVSESQIGLLITLFAATVVISTAPLTALTRKYSRKKLLITLIVIFVVANLLAAAAPNYWVLASARVLGGLAHGLFWSVVAAYTGGLVPKRQIGRPVAITGGGGTAAFVLGVPVGTALGHALGWRLAFVVIAVSILLLLVLMIRYLPAIQHIPKLATGEIALPLYKDKSVPGVVIVCLIVVLLLTAHNTFATYMAPYLIGPVSIAPAAVAGILLLNGVGGAVGLTIAGVVADRWPRAALITAIGVLIVGLLIVGLFPHVFWVEIAAMFLWSAAFGSAPPMLQARMLHTASPRMRDTAAAYITTSFNLAIGAGAFFGGLLLDFVSLRALPFVDIVGSLAAVVMVLVGDAWLRRRGLVRKTS
jgi:predicted MFS family arabinose efflux permease